MRKHNIEREKWFVWVKRFGDWLCAHQNADGSYYRSYNVDGEPAAESKNNTTHAIPFLVEFYKVTDNKSYLKAAVAAGEYAWKDVHLKAAYVSGTPDNPDVTDKEAALLTIDAFIALYEATDDKHFYDVANLILHNTKQLLDTDGSKGYSLQVFRQRVYRWQVDAAAELTYGFHG